jgi:hypothetical protein
MSETVDLTFLSGLVQGLDREMRLMRLQVTQLAALSPRIGVIEQSFHDLAGEMAHGFGQMQQQMARQEKRIDALDTGLAALRTDLAESTARIIQAIEAKA